MNAIPKTKLCWNCEARVTPYEENCPCCCVYLDPLPKPRGGEAAAAETESSIPASPFGAMGRERRDAHEEAEKEVADSEDDAYEKGNPLISMALLLCGSLFLFFGIALYFFSVDGVLTLKWSSEYWYVYLAIAVSLIGFGWKKLYAVEE